MTLQPMPPPTGLARPQFRYLSASDLFRDVLTADQIEAHGLLEAVSQRMVAIEQQLEAAIFKGIVPRIAGLLLREARNGEVTGFSHQDLAERLGIYRETATNALNELKAARVVDIGRRRIAILDRARLERIAAD